MWSKVFWAILSLMLLTQNVIALEKDSAAIEAAKKHFEDAKVFYDARDFDQAVHSFRMAYKYKPTWKLLYNIGQAEAAAKRYGLALDAFEGYLARGGDDIREDRSLEVLDEIKRLRLLVGVLKVSAPIGAEVFVDSINRGSTPLQQILRVAVGEHLVRVELDSRIILEELIHVSGGMTTSVKATATGDVGPVNSPQQNLRSDLSETSFDEASPVSDKPSRRKFSLLTFPSWPKRQKLFFTGGASSIALGIASLAVGVGFTVRASRFANQRDRYEDKYIETDDGDYYYLAANEQDKLDKAVGGMVAGYVAGGVFAVAGTVLLVIFFKEKYSRTSRVLPNGTGLGVIF
ncbi:MAG: PEGA domain-containing protein [Deltaproteobacteria bacterium]|nr:PEGA domain-containing protein [Deltaproteobacteria bacterium]